MPEFDINDLPIGEPPLPGPPVAMDTEKLILEEEASKLRLELKEARQNTADALKEQSKLQDCLKESARQISVFVKTQQELASALDEADARYRRLLVDVATLFRNRTTNTGDDEDDA